MSDSNKRNILDIIKVNSINLFILTIPLLIGLQSFLPKWAETITIALKLVIGPLFILFFLNKEIIYVRIVLLLILHHSFLSVFIICKSFVST